MKKKNEKIIVSSGWYAYRIRNKQTTTWHTIKFWNETRFAHYDHSLNIFHHFVVSFFFFLNFCWRETAIVMRWMLCMFVNMKASFVVVLIFFKYLLCNSECRHFALNTINSSALTKQTKKKWKRRRAAAKAAEMSKWKIDSE